MSSLSAKDRASLCSFTFADGRRCRTPRSSGHPHLCSDHAQKEARARAAQKLGKDLAYFFSGDYLSACDLSTALARLIPAVLRGDVKPRAARTVAYLAQTLLQAIHLAQDEYINAFDTDGWRRAIRNSVKGNHDHLFPPAPKPDQPAAAPSNAPQPAPFAFRETPRNAPSALRTNLRSPLSQHHPAQTPVNWHSDTVAQAVRPGGPAFSSSPAQPPTQAPQSEIATLSEPAQSPHTPLPPTGTEFVQQLVAGLPRPVPPGLTGKIGDSQTPSESQLQSAHGARPAPAPIGNAGSAARGETSRPSQSTSTPSRTPNRDACLRFNNKRGFPVDGKPV